MIKVICEKCQTVNLINEKEKGSGKFFYCLNCKGFFFKIGPKGEIIRVQIELV